MQVDDLSAQSIGTACAPNSQDCGRPYYVEDYNAFYAAIKAVYPDMVLIANCPMGDGAPTDLWDWHSYDASWTMFNRMHEFDNLRRGQDAPVFVSEYAVTADGGWGNLRVSPSAALGSNLCVVPSVVNAVHHI